VTLTHTLVLNPRISYEGIRDDYSKTPDLLQYLEKSMTNLCKHFTLKCASARSTGTQRAFTERPHASSSIEDLSMVSFISRYKRGDNSDRDELAEYFKLLREDWDSCNPLQWWVG
jgi:hypothetical protein